MITTLLSKVMNGEQFLTELMGFQAEVHSVVLTVKSVQTIFEFFEFFFMFSLMFPESFGDFKIVFRDT